MIYNLAFKTHLYREEIDHLYRIQNLQKMLVGDKELWPIIKETFNNQVVYKEILVYTDTLVQIVDKMPEINWQIFEN